MNRYTIRPLTGKPTDDTMMPQTIDHYRRAYSEGAAKAIEMPNWMLRRCVTHATRLAVTKPGTGSIALHEAAWGSADSYADEIVRRRAIPVLGSNTSRTDLP